MTPALLGLLVLLLACFPPDGTALISLKQRVSFIFRHAVTTEDGYTQHRSLTSSDGDDDDKSTIYRPIQAASSQRIPDHVAYIVDGNGRWGIRRHIHSYTLIYTHIHLYTLIYAYIHLYTLIYTHI